MKTAIIVLFAVLACLLLLLALLLFCRLAVRVSYSQDLRVYALLGFLKIKLYPKKERKKKNKKVKRKKIKEKPLNLQEKTAEDSEKAKKSPFDTKAQKMPSTSSGASDVLGFIGDIVKNALSFLGNRARIDVDRLCVVVSRKEAADTAIQFGISCGAVSTLIALCSEFGSYNIKYENVEVVPDFVTGKSRIEADISISSRVIWILTCLIKIFYKKLISSERTARK